MKSRRFLHVLLSGVVCAWGVPLLAQSVISAQSGLVHYAEGRVLLDGHAVDAKVGQFPQMKENQVLKTEEGRAEVLLTPGAFLRVGENSELRMLSTRLTDARLEFLSGAVVIEAAELKENDNRITVVCGGASVSLVKRGLYRFQGNPAEVMVYDGEALVQDASGSLTLKKGKMVALGGALVARSFDRGQMDTLDRWSARRAENLSLANVWAARSLYNSGSYWGSSGWRWNQWLGMYTFVPYSGVYYSPYGYNFWSPESVYVVYVPTGGSGYGGGSRGGYYDSTRGYTVTRPTSTGNSGTMATRSQAPTTSATGSTAPIPRPSGHAGGGGRTR